jgi:hypothetical protein
MNVEKRTLKLFAYGAVLEQVDNVADFDGVRRAWSNDELATTKIGDARINHAVRTTHHANHTGMSDTQHFTAFELRGQINECIGDACNNRIVRFETWWAIVIGKVTRPITFDLCVREALPFANICFAKSQIWFKQSGSETFGNDVCGHACPTKIARSNRIEHAKFLHR